MDGCMNGQKDRPMGSVTPQQTVAQWRAKNVGCRRYQ